MFGPDTVAIKEKCFLGERSNHWRKYLALVIPSLPVPQLAVLEIRICLSHFYNPCHLLNDVLWMSLQEDMAIPLSLHLLSCAADLYQELVS